MGTKDETETRIPAQEDAIAHLREIRKLALSLIEDAHLGRLFTKEERETIEDVFTNLNGRIEFI